MVFVFQPFQVAQFRAISFSFFLASLPSSTFVTFVLHGSRQVCEFSTSGMIIVLVVSWVNNLLVLFRK